MTLPFERDAAWDSARPGLAGIALAPVGRPELKYLVNDEYERCSESREPRPPHAIDRRV
jgi:hypothetical protein